MNLLSIVIPVYNEEATIARVVERVLAVAMPAGVACELILVDDGSRDGSWPAIERLPAAHPGATFKLFRQQPNQGKGAALRRGFEAAAGDVVIIQDADLEYDPACIPAVIAPILAGRADVVYGSRFARKSGPGPLFGKVDLVHFFHGFGNRVLTWLSNMATGLRLTDMETCYKAFHGELARRLDIQSDRFEVEPELTAKAARLAGPRRIVEVPITYRSRSYAEGKKITWIDGLKAIWTILRYRFKG
ncbi:MAG: Dodecaprenyl-phosphate galacturonate synthase [Phycisphaerae bacterium]|nr:Dodecaprenyl-phosphate galacturonate synthase [Phycisphaerae bacterium]